MSLVPSSPPLTDLPIDAQLEDITKALASQSAVVVEAAPGAGKTTRIPYALLAEPWCQEKVLVSEPRRIAARLAALRVADERGHRLGDEVGYRVRFDEKAGPRTRLEYLTEGLLLRRVLSNGFGGVSALVLDEVHERSEDMDVLMALSQRALREGATFKLLLMSATLDAGALSSHFGAVRCRSEGRSFPVEIHHHKSEDSRPLPIQIRSAVKQALTTDGDILVFLPGAREIRAAQAALEELGSVEVAILHGDLPLTEQAKVVSRGSRRRVVLSTNVAESSLTIPGITTVIDSGLGRSAHFDAFSGVTRLQTSPVSQARCIQRAGRAGRVAPGQAIRLFTKSAFEARPVQDVPELQRADLSALMLRLLDAGTAPETLPWFDAPKSESWTSAREFLSRLGAVDEDKLTPIGAKMARLPLPARLSRIVVEGHRLGLLAETSLAAAILSERDVMRRRKFGTPATDVEASDSDLEARMEVVQHLREERFSRRLAEDLGADAEGARQVDKVAQAIEREAALACSDLEPLEPTSPSLTRALLPGFFDRVAQRKSGRELVLENGSQATLDESSAVVNAPLLIALGADAPDGRRRKTSVRIACRVDADSLFETFPERVTATEEVVFVPTKERVESTSQLRYGKIVLDESRSLASPGEETARVLFEAALARGPRAFDPESKLEALHVRLRLLKEHFPTEMQEIDETEECINLACLRAACAFRTNLDELRQATLDDEYIGSLSDEVQRLLRQEAPKEATLRGGRRIPIHYEKGKSPWIESRLQDFFSMTDSPTICRGRVPLLIHFLAPNHRALQVTTDLSGFWERHYPDLRRQLMRKYPRHLWPEDGRTAQPPPPGKIR